MQEDFNLEYNEELLLKIIKDNIRFINYIRYNSISSSITLEIKNNTILYALCMAYYHTNSKLLSYNQFKLPYLYVSL